MRELPPGDAQNYLVYRFLDVAWNLAAVRKGSRLRLGAIEPPSVQR